MPTRSFLYYAALLATLILAPCATLSSAAVISPQLQSSLDIESPDPIPAIIVLTATEAPSMLARRLGPRQRNQIVSELKRGAELNRSNLVYLLRQRDIDNPRPLWLINGVAVSAPADVLLEAASLANVQAIILDESLQLPSVLDSTDTPVEWNISRTRAPQLWNMGYDGTGITIAILDSGVNINHPDIVDRWRGLPGDWFDPYNHSTTPYDFGIFHGTGVASIALGNDYGGSSIGIAPGASLIAAKLFRDDGTANVSYIIEALQWVLNPGGNPQHAPAVINNSWGFIDNAGECLATLGAGQNALHLRSAIQTIREAGIVVVSSAGNSGPADGTSISPANFPESLAVGATGSQDTIAGFSSRGPSACPGDPTFPDIVAPGVSVKAAAGGSGINAGYQYVSGTSFASPHVTGAVALLLSAVNNLGVDELETALKSAAIDLGPSGTDYTYGHGLVDVAQALLLIDENLFLGKPILTLIGTVPDSDDPAIEIVDFGFLAVGENTQKTLILRNSGGGTLELDLSTEQLGPQFSIEESSCSNAALQTGDECSFRLSFSTADIGFYSGEMTIESNDSDRPEQLIQVKGYADIPFSRLDIEPAAISFGQVPPGTVRNQTLTLSSTGTAAVESISFDQTDLFTPYSTLNNNCHGTLDVNETCGLTIRFYPQEVGAYEGQIVIISNDSETPMVPVLINGTGNTPPTRPKPLFPINGVRISSAEPITFTWEAATDADGDEVTHSLFLSKNVDLSDPLNLNSLFVITMFMGLSVLGIRSTNLSKKAVFYFFLLITFAYLNSCGGGGGSSGTSTASTTSFTLSQTVDSLQAGTYYWKVTADDGRGGSSESDIESFAVE